MPSLGLLPNAEWMNVPQGKRHTKGRDLGPRFWEALHSSRQDICFILDLGPESTCVSDLRSRLEELERGILPVVHGSECLMTLADRWDGLTAEVMFRCMYHHLTQVEGLLEQKRQTALRLVRDRRIAAGDRITVEVDLLSYWYKWQDMCFAARRDMADVMPRLKDAVDKLSKTARCRSIHVPSRHNGSEMLTEEEQIGRLVAIIAVFKETDYFAKHGFAVVVKFGANTL